MTTRTIFVSLKEGGNKPKLKLRDSDGHNPGNDDLTTDVDTNDTVIWKLDTNSGLGGLSGIRKKNESDNNDLLTGPPRAVNGEYHGTVVAVSPGKGKKEKYEVGFTLPGNTTVYWTDPKLKMNS